MTPSIYEKLREQLDQYSVGFPATQSGIEIKILKKLFTEEEAEMYLDMTMMLETPEAVAARTGRRRETVSAMLANMAQKGLLFRQSKAEEVKYAAVAFVIGSYEFQLKNMDRDLAEMVEAYFQEGFFDFAPGKNIVPLRTIPVQQSIQVEWPVAPYMQAREIIKTKEKIALADCICRVQQQLIGNECDKPREVCLLFGSHADYYVENKLARYISQEEALKVLDVSEKAGLVNQPANMINPGGMCNCCGDCCGLLRALNKMSNPAQLVFSHYSATVDPDLCTACETCLTRCQMAAISINDDQVAVVNTDRCIGCGLCVTTCPTEAIALTPKPEDQLTIPPASGRELMEQTSKTRGTMLIPLSMRNE
ncbi:MAG: 4Fe-4S binding protein [Deltaproteobacteria bacterium]|nr:4Fe-4S binding protein [Deltaproteobacteria bacterium]